MVDIFSRKKRSKVMSKIRSRNTALEIIMKRKLRGKNLAYQPNIYGKPDFADTKKKIAVFVDSCFWHKCPIHYKEPKTHIKFWKNKIWKNVLRDAEVSRNYLNSGWNIRRIWEHDI